MSILSRIRALFKRKTPKTPALAPTRYAGPVPAAAHTFIPKSMRNYFLDGRGDLINPAKLYARQARRFKRQAKRSQKLISIRQLGA